LYKGDEMISSMFTSGKRFHYYVSPWHNLKLVGLQCASLVNIVLVSYPGTRICCFTDHPIYINLTRITV